MAWAFFVMNLELLRDTRENRGARNALFARRADLEVATLDFEREDPFGGGNPNDAGDEVADRWRVLRHHRELPLGGTRHDGRSAPLPERRFGRHNLNEQRTHD